MPQTLRLAFRGANLERPLDSPPFEVIEGEEAVFVLRPWIRSDGEESAPDLFMPAAGFGSRVPLPVEGREALVAAIEAIIAFQDADDHNAALDQLGRWLEGTNPWLIDVALSQAARYSYADERWIPGLLARSNDASPKRRAWAADAIGIAMSRGRFGEREQAASALVETDGQGELRETLIRLARTDLDAIVRRRAVVWMAKNDLPGAREILDVISRDDESQDVRYEAAAGLIRLKDADRASRPKSPR